VYFAREQHADVVLPGRVAPGDEHALRVRGVEEVVVGYVELGEVVAERDDSGAPVERLQRAAFPRALVDLRR
jgi:hypothetical protein